jgi:hypothetical protein
MAAEACAAFRKLGAPKKIVVQKPKKKINVVLVGNHSAGKRFAEKIPDFDLLCFVGAQRSRELFFFFLEICLRAFFFFGWENGGLSLDLGCFCGIFGGFVVFMVFCVWEVVIRVIESMRG